MTFEIILQIILLGLALSMDAFAVSVTDGLIYTDINKKKIFFINRTQKNDSVRKIELKNEQRTHFVRIGQGTHLLTTVSIQIGTVFFYN